MLNGKEEEEMLSESQRLLDFAETGSGTVANRHLSPWGTCEDLLLASAILKHGTGKWSTISGELQARALVLNVSPTLFSDEACKCRFLALNGRFARCASSSSSRNDDLENPIPWFEELRKLRVAQLKRELEHYEDSIGSLQRKLKRLKAEKAQSTLANNPGGKQTGDNDSFDQDSRKCSFDDAAQTEKPFETPTVGDHKSLSGVAELSLKRFTDSDSKQEFSVAASEQSRWRDDHGDQSEATVKITATSQQADVKAQSDRSSLTQAADSHPSVESSKDYGRYSCVVAGRSQTVDGLGVHDLPFAEKVAPVSSDAGVQYCGTATKARYPLGEPAGDDICIESVEAYTADAVAEKNEEIPNLEFPIGDGLEAELQSDSVSKEPEIGPAPDRNVLVLSGKVEADSKEVCTHVEAADCSTPLPIEASASSSVKRVDDTCPRVVGISEEPPQSEGLERTASGANAMDLLRLAYGSAQDATPVCTPEPSELQPQVESEAVMEQDSVPRYKPPSTPASLVTSPPGELSFPTDRARHSDPKSVTADGNSPNARRFVEEYDNPVPILNINGDLNRVSNAEIPSLSSNEKEVTAAAEVNVLDVQVAGPDGNPNKVKESESIPDKYLRKSQSAIEPVVEVREVDPAMSTSGNLSPLQSLFLPSQQENGAICAVQVPNTEEIPVTIVGQFDSGEEVGFVEGRKPVLKQEVPPSDKIFDNETESALSHDGNASSSMEESSKRFDDVAMEPGKPDGGTTLVGTGSPTPVDVDTKIAPPNVSEEDGLLRDVMMLKPTKLSNLRKRQMLCNGGNHTGGSRNHMSPKESRESSADTLAGKQVKLEDVTGNVTMQPKEVSEANSNSISTVLKEESPPLKPRQFKLRSGRVKGFVKTSEGVAGLANKVPESRVLEAFATGIRDDSGTQAFPSQNTCPGPNKIVLSIDDTDGKGSVAQDRSTLESKTAEENLGKGMRDLRESQLEKIAETATPANGNDDGSPPAKRVRADIKALPLLECLHIVGAHRFAPLFKRRQESQENDRYKCLIRRHMDLNIVTSQLEEGMYAESTEFFRDLLLIFNNALVFYSRDSQEYGAARVLRECVMREMEKTLQTEVPQKVSGRTTRKREAKKIGEVANTAPAATTSDGKRRGSLRSSSSDHVGSAASSDGGVSTRATDVGLERSSSVSRDGEGENNSLQQAKELEMEEKERGSKDVSISYTRSKSKAKVQQASEDGKTEKISVQRRKDLKEKNGRSPEDDMGLRISERKEAASSSQGLKKSSQNSVKVTAKNDDSESSSKTAKSVSGRQDLTRKSSAGRPPRNSQFTHPVSKGNQLSFQSQKRGRT